MALASHISSFASLSVQLGRDSYHRYRKLGPLAKTFVWFLILLYITIIAAVIFVGPSRIFQKTYDIAQELRNMRLGWLIIAVVAVLTSFPPLIGYFTAMTICGFAYGVKGFLIAAPSAIVGSALTFIVLRLLFKPRIKSWTRQNKKWQAMEQVIEAKGLPLIILIRLCPIPWVYSNAFFASIEAVSLFQFIIATICLLPKIFLVVFIGSQVAVLSDGSHRNTMSTATKVLDVLSIVITVAIAIGTGWFVWKWTEEKIRHMEGLSDETDRLAADALEEANAPLLGPLSNVSSESLDERLGASPLDEVLNQLTGRTKNEAALADNRV